MVVSNAQVLTAGTRYDQEKAKDGAPIPSTVVTLLVTPEDGERVALAASEGQIMLALRNPLDHRNDHDDGRADRRAVRCQPAARRASEARARARGPAKPFTHPPAPAPAPGLHGGGDPRCQAIRGDGSMRR